ncbi:MAG: polyphosphate kinase 1 [Bdellovibrionales bacterium]
MNGEQLLEYSNSNGHNGNGQGDGSDNGSSTSLVKKLKPIEVTEPKATETKAPEFINRDLSWLEFNRRVLHEALDVRTPLLERLKFLGIFNSNLDEFYMKRVGGLKLQVAAGLIAKTHEGFSASALLQEIRQKVMPMLKLQADGLSKELLPALKQRNIHVLNWSELTESEVQLANKYFQENVFPILTPLAVDPGHPFPFLSNLSISLGIVLRHPEHQENLFARIKIPQAFPQLFRLNPESADSYRFIKLQDIIIQNLSRLFPNMQITSVMPFRITRNIEIARDEEDAVDLLEMIEEELRQRKFARIVRLEHGPQPDPWILSFLMSELEISEDEIYELPGELDYNIFRQICDIRIAELKYEPWIPVIPLTLIDQEVSIFQTIKKADVLLHHPYDSFSASVERFIQTASEDSRVLAIKMTLYRTDENSAFVRSLVRAAESGKQVVCIIEVKARFDEARNINWAQTLEDAGVHVVYGIVGLKTHIKTALVVRQEPEGLRSYVHLGTGNYHSGTARLYSDFSLLTSQPEYTQDVIELFHYLTGRSLKNSYKKLLVAPVNMKDRFLQMIDREITNKKEGKPAHIIAKMNNLEDQAICRALYKASQAGVDVDLIVRGFCSLRPGVPGLSENIRVLSVIGRFLEHARVYYFRNGARDGVGGEFYIGSADWMYRNLHARVEAVFAVDDRLLKEKCWEVFQLTFLDQRQVWEMKSDGSYVQRQPQNEAQQLGLHQLLMKSTKQRSPPSMMSLEEEVVPAEKGGRSETRRRTSRKSRRKK